MDSVLVPMIVGIIIIIIGIQNMKGNITMLHRYHRKRVSEEDMIVFGRKVGLGTIIVGCSVIVKAGCQFAAQKFNMESLNTIGTVLLGVGFLAGFAIIFAALFKYNKGIF